ncbi:hypothetical protein [Phenylobacterium sp.]|uniref:hypothetical protein n=1 Tax=Phenylobacterium sp. TaxID=1871053 RepID=UPI00374CD07F
MWLWSFALPFCMAIGLPMALFVSRSVVRNQRGALYNDLIMALFPEGGSEALPQLELVRSKYDSGHGQEDHAAHAVKNVKRDPKVLILTTLLFCAMSFLGFTLLLTPKACLLGGLCDVKVPFRLPDALLWSGDIKAVTTDFSQAAVNTMTIGALGFLGAYVAASQYLIRQLLNYELEAVSFLRSAFQLGMGVTVSVVAYRAIQGGLQLGLDAFGRGGQITAAAPWLGIAFLIGMAPQTGLSWLAGRLKLTLQKAVDLEGLEATKLISVEIIEGIDTDTKVRLDQSNIIDVQNLATRNPIELYIETPFGLLEVFDWVLQAQLCTVVGARAYDALKSHNIRTIFDLERAVLAEEVPDSYVAALGQVIYTSASADFKKAISKPTGGLDPAVVRHAVAVVCDDLHVHRLRALWRRILLRSMPPGDDGWLYRSSPLPGDQGFGLPPASPLAAQFMGLAAALGVDYETRRAAGDPQADLDKVSALALGAAKDSLMHDAKGVELLRRLLDCEPAAPKFHADLSMFRDDPRFRALLSWPPAARARRKPSTGKPRRRAAPKQAKKSAPRGGA